MMWWACSTAKAAPVARPMKFIG
uniref:Uncharacterized protein n=1 Tax=Nelumbo nucifera TaxID=4432 RepID=A0A822XRC3_NELNU|nr:TPA_asm: hypothetical protein HUJ06_024035 [Nelumbo nucifera]